jgi:hypothetical protein
MQIAICEYQMCRVLCAPSECIVIDRKEPARCKHCIKEICCCIDIKAKIEGEIIAANHHQSFLSALNQFFRNAKTLYPIALGIEVLCIASAELGENTGLFLFGYRNPVGIVIAYAMGYGLASFSTFVIILGRYNYGSNEKGICSCCSVLEQQTENNGFVPALKSSFKNFIKGIRKMPQLHKQPNLTTILKTSLIILVTAETACILIAETVDLVLYKSLFLSVPLALFAGAFTVVAPEAYKKTKRKMKNDINNNKTITPSNSNFIGLKRFNKK